MSDPSLAEPRRRGRRFVTAAVVALCVALAVRTWVVEGLLLPVRVAGGSMAPTLLGGHYRIACGDCGFPIRCGWDQAPPEERLTCPNCGHHRNPLAEAAPTAGQRVLIDKVSLAMRPPARWEVAVLRTPHAAGPLAVKRVVGLPGERISIRRGDLLADGVLLRKPLAVLRTMAVTVYDDAYRPTDADRQPRLAGHRADSAWTMTPDGYAAAGKRDAGGGAAPDAGGGAARDANAGGERSTAVGSAVVAPSAPAGGYAPTLDRTLDWLTYRHRPGLPPPTPRRLESPVYDNDPYNQRLSRQLNPVSDLMLECRVRWWGAGELAVALHDGRSWFEARLRGGPEGALTLLRDGGTVHRATRELPAAGRDFLLEAALCDQQWIVAIDGRVLAIWEYEVDPRAPIAPQPRPLAIGVRDLQVEIRRLRLLRDVYYLHPAGSRGDWEMPGPLGRAEYFVLGDNAPASEDSRAWPAPGAALRQFVGRALWRRRGER